MAKAEHMAAPYEAWTATGLSPSKFNNVYMWLSRAAIKDEGARQGQELVAYKGAKAVNPNMDTALDPRILSNLDTTLHSGMRILAVPHERLLHAQRTFHQQASQEVSRLSESYHQPDETTILTWEAMLEQQGELGKSLFKTVISEREQLVGQIHDTLSTADSRLWVGFNGSFTAEDVEPPVARCSMLRLCGVFVDHDTADEVNPELPRIVHVAEDMNGAQVTLPRDISPILYYRPR